MAAHTSNLLDAHLEQVNARLKDASPMAAYALGMLTVVFLQTQPRRPIPTVLMDAAMEVRGGGVAVGLRLGGTLASWAGGALLHRNPSRARRRAVFAGPAC